MGPDSRSNPFEKRKTDMIQEMEEIFINSAHVEKGLRSRFELSWGLIGERKLAKYYDKAMELKRRKFTSQGPSAMWDVKG